MCLKSRRSPVRDPSSIQSINMPRLEADDDAISIDTVADLATVEPQLPDCTSLEAFARSQGHSWSTLSPAEVAAGLAAWPSRSNSIGLSTNIAAAVALAQSADANQPVLRACTALLSRATSAIGIGSGDKGTDVVDAFALAALAFLSSQLLLTRSTPPATATTSITCLTAVCRAVAKEASHGQLHDKQGARSVYCTITRAVLRLAVGVATAPQSTSKASGAISGSKRQHCRKGSDHDAGQGGLVTHLPQLLGMVTVGGGDCGCGTWNTHPWNTFTANPMPSSVAVS
jgi:hypothetical protein